jgi:aquaporin TIP
MEDKNLRGYVAEFLGTFVVVFVSAATVCANVRADVQGWMVVTVALAAGCAYAAALAFTLPYSNGFLNPAMPVTLWVFRHLSGARAFGYTIVQLLGGVVAGGVLRVLFSYPEGTARANHLGAPHLVAETLGDDPFTMRLKGIAIELVLTFAIALVAYGTIVRRRTLNKPDRLSALWIGLAVTAATLAGFPMTGAALNPARWFGPVMWEVTLPNPQAFTDHVAYWVGPIGGSLLAGWFYNSFLAPPRESSPPGATV